MADEEHLRILRKGTRAWNRWRRENPEVLPDLSRADLHRANLSHANLRGANLHRADLSGANLHWANLREANLRGANLTGVWLTDSLGRAPNLSGADLRGIKITSEEESGAGSSILELACCAGIDATSFGDSEVLTNFLARAFEYAHRQDTLVSRIYPEVVSRALSRIKALGMLYAEQETPRQVVELVRTISAELIVYLSKHPEALYDIRPRQFEELIAEILAHYGWLVQLTPPTKDGGYDIFAISKDLTGIRTSWIIECKKYRKDRKVGVDVARALYAVKGEVKAANAILATTSDFTEGVKRFKASRWDFELRNYEAVLEWINEYKPNPNGRLYIRENRLILPGDS